MQCSSEIDAKFTEETKQLCNVFVTAHADAIHPIRATVVGRLATRELDPPCLSSAYLLPPAKSIYNFTWLYVIFKGKFCFGIVLIYSLKNLEYLQVFFSLDNTLTRL